jgi:two-component system, NtrC family, response regulator HydG
MARFLIIDDNETMREGMAVTVRHMGHEAVTAASGAEGLAALRKLGADFVITELNMEGVGGLDVLEAVKRLDPSCPTLIVTSLGTVETAVEAMRLGAMDFLQKPFAPELLCLKVERALETRHAKVARQPTEAEVTVLRADAPMPYGLSEMASRSPQMRALFETVEKVAPSDVAVHISGEPGTGKELVARAVHTRSKRAAGPFVKLNCGSLNEAFFESELFGDEKSTFASAIKRKLGHFELADKWTLFLDDVGDMTPNLQLKLLRVLQEKEFERAAGEECVRADVRLISATNRDIRQEVETGRFREDLFYYLHVVPCHVPPLRERREDIPALVEHFIRKLGPRTNPSIQRIDDAALTRLGAYNWPGNLRELENAVVQSLVFANGDSIGVAALPAFLREGTGETPPAVPSSDMTLPEFLEDMERQLVQRTYVKAGGVKTETARLLGIKTSALYYKLEKYGIGGAAGKPADQPREAPEDGDKDEP